MSIQALREKREALSQRATKLLDGTSAEKWSANDQKVYDEALAELRGIDNEINHMQAGLDLMAQNAFGELSESGRNPAAAGGTRKPGGWYDSKTGKVVNVLTPAQRLTDLRESAPGKPQVRLGDMVAAKITGAGSPEVRNALTEGTDSEGGFTVPEWYSTQWIDLMRSKTRVVQAGARTVPMPGLTLDMAKLASDPAPAWRLEAAPIADTDVTFARVRLEARWLGCKVITSRELLEDSPNAGEMLDMALAGSMATAWDRAALIGSGTAPEPRGVSNTVGVAEIQMGTNGAALTGYGELLQAASTLATNNSEPPTAAIMAPRTLYEGYAGLTATDGQPLRPPRVLDELPMLHTSGMPVDETQGTATDASRILVGDFRHVLLGIRSDVRFQAFQAPRHDTHETVVVVWMRADVAVTQPGAFAQITGVVPAA